MARMSDEEYVEKMSQAMSDSFKEYFRDRIVPDDTGKMGFPIGTDALKRFFQIPMERVLSDLKDWPEEGAELEFHHD